MNLVTVLENKQPLATGSRLKIKPFGARREMRVPGRRRW